MRNLIHPFALGNQISTALVGLRVVMGLAFVLHGAPKVQHAFTWMGSESGVPGFLQATAAEAEFCGGIALAFGLFTRVAALGIAGVMIGALVLVHLPHGDAFVGKPGAPSGEPALIYLVCAFLFVLVGAGEFSLDGLMFGGENRSVVESGPRPEASAGVASPWLMWRSRRRA